MLMSVNEKVYDPMDSLLASFTAGENAPKQRWWTKKDVASPDLARPVPIRKASGEMLRLVQCVFLSPATLAPRRVMFCGIDDDNSSEVCASAGRVLAEQTGADVCLVDANIRHGRLSKLFELDQKKARRGGLSSWGEQCVSVDKNLFVAGTGVLEGSDYGLASARELRDRITALSITFEYLLIDAPGVNTSSETGVIGQVAGSAVLVLEANSTRRAEAKRAKETLQMANVRILGSVLDKHSQ
jgi:Mrp family chromosome partitioning ATPase